VPDFEVSIVEHPSPLFEQADELRYSVLFEPYGVARDDCWNDADESSVHAMAVADGQVVGYARLLLLADHTAHIRQVAVVPDWERRGVGRALMESLCDRASDLGITDIWLDARLMAVPFYERLGFRVTSGVFKSGRTSLPHVRMDRSM
jgi:ribosomal protein S18 acetylase RimI-like enzyme